MNAPVLSLLVAAAASAPARSPADLVDALHQAFGHHHVRAVHAKGLTLAGVFTPDPQAAALTSAPHLQRKQSQVIVRFSDFTGIPDIPDTAGPANPRGIAIRFQLPDGSSTDLVGHSFDGFPTPTSDEFHDLLLAIAASGQGARSPTALDRYLASHPVAKTFLTTQKTPASYATIAYFGVNSFRFTSAALASSFVRYQIEPEAGERLLTPAELGRKGPDYLAEEIRDRIGHGPIRFRVVAQIADAGDRVEDPSVAWPASRRRVPLGVLELRRLAPEAEATAFVPGNLPAGIDGADPMIGFRTKAYPISVRERQEVGAAPQLK